MTVDPPSGVRVPPYLLTAGRTTGSVVLALESRVQRLHSRVEPDEKGASYPELRAILRVCRLPTPVIEVAGRTRLPIQVTRILIGDLIDKGLVGVEPAAGSGERPDIQLLERVLSGLREAG